MNKKKLFGVLAAASMLMNSGVAVFAEEMVEVEAGSVGGTTVDQATEVKLDEVNFPDNNFRKAVIDAANNITGVTGNPYADGKNITTELLGKIKTLAPSVTGKSDAPTDKADDAADYASSSATPFADLTGIEYLTGLQYLTLLNSPNLKVADLSNNDELISVIIAPVPSASATNAPASIQNGSATSAKDSNDLYSITLPEETENLTELFLEGASQLTTLDLSSYEELTKVYLVNNELAQLDVSGCTSLINLNISGNALTGLDLGTNSSLTTLNAAKNNLYEITFAKKLTSVDLSDNKLATVDTSTLKNLATLNLSDNRLESVDFSSNGSLLNLNISNNHLATLDLSESGPVKTATTDGSYNATNTTVTAGTLTVSPQYLYANVDDGGIDLASYDENFQAKDSNNLGWVAAAAASSTNQVTGGTITKAGVLEFGTNIKPTVATSGISYNYSIGSSTLPQMTVNVVQADLMNRLYNPNSGEHFYTKDLNEKDTLVKLGWQYEGIGWVAPQENYPTAPVKAGEAVFRLYNPNAGDHHYTADAKEKDVLVRAGWNYEGVGWYSAQKHDDDTTTVNDGTNTYTGITSYSIPVYREYNPNAKEAGAHNYTTSENENDTLVALGWLDEGIGWWALK